MLPMEIKEYTYKAGDFSFSILNLGCAITSICTPDKNGNVQNITLPFKGATEDPNVILNSDKFFGLTVGRFANRIAKARFTIDGQEYLFSPNDNDNLLHSGRAGIWARLWDVRKVDDGFLCQIKITQADDGFPGDADIRVRFSLTSDGLFRIHYTASVTKSCPLNLTNHTYFNLSGNPTSDILSHQLKLFCSSVLSVDKNLIPDGQTMPVNGTALDFLQAKPIGQDIDSPLLRLAGGYDHCLIIDKSPRSSRYFTQFAEVLEPRSGRILQAFTDMPAFHLYTGNFLNGEQGYPRRSGFCLETEFYPDSVNHPSFPSCLVHPGELFESTTIYHFFTTTTA